MSQYNYIAIVLLFVVQKNQIFVGTCCNWIPLNVALGEFCGPSALICVSVSPFQLDSSEQVLPRSSYRALCSRRSSSGLGTWVSLRFCDLDVFCSFVKPTNWRYLIVLGTCGFHRWEQAALICSYLLQLVEYVMWFPALHNVAGSFHRLCVLSAKNIWCLVWKQRLSPEGGQDTHIHTHTHTHIDRLAHEQALPRLSSYSERKLEMGHNSWWWWWFSWRG